MNNHGGRNSLKMDLIYLIAKVEGLSSEISSPIREILENVQGVVDQLDADTTICKGVESMYRLHAEAEKCGMNNEFDESVEFMDTSETSDTDLIQTAMSNHIILGTIFKHMNSSDLLQLRRVSRMWNTFAMETISKSKSLTVILDVKRMSALHLEDLNQIVLSSRKFPISSLHLSLNVLDADNDAVELFMDLHGPQIKTLVLLKSTGRDETANLIILLTFHCQNVEYIKMTDLLNSRVLQDWDLYEVTSSFLLPSLKTIDVEDVSYSIGVSQIICDMIRSAENLNLFLGESVPFPVLTRLRSRNKMGCVQNYRITDSTASHTISDFQYHQPKLRHLDIDLKPSNWLQSLTHYLKLIIESSKETLESLRVYTFFMMTSKTGITVLPNLKHLHLYYNPQDLAENIIKTEKENEKQLTKQKPRGIKPIFPENSRMSNIFPALETLVLQLHKFDKKTLRKYFPGESCQHPTMEPGAIDCLLSVKNLELDCKFTKFGLQRLAVKFPNVKNIKVKDVHDLFKNDSIWFLPWQKLETLELRGFIFDGQIMHRSFDSFFTGFPDGVCTNLKNLIETKAGVEHKRFKFDVSVAQTSGSVRDLQNLKVLKVVFDSSQNSNWGFTVLKNDCVIITEVTGMYAFDLMPGLQSVIFAYDHHQPNSKAMAAALRPMSRFFCVRMEHEPQFETECKSNANHVVTPITEQLPLVVNPVVHDNENDDWE